MRTAPKRHSKINWDGISYGLKTIGIGVSGLVLEFDEKRVVKISTGSPQSLHDIEIERDAYAIFSKHPRCSNIVKCYDYNHPGGIILEKLNELVRRRLHLEGAPPLETALNWSLGAAKGLTFIHQRKVIQGDVGCHNMLLDHHGTLKIGDFSGSSINGGEATVHYETRSQAPFNCSQPDEETDIFALGCAIYEMCLGYAPYHDRPEYEVAQLYQAANFPDRPQHLDHGTWDIIHKCWKRQYCAANNVARDIEQTIYRIKTVKPGHNDVSFSNPLQIIDSRNDKEGRRLKTRTQPPSIQVHLAKQNKQQNKKSKPKSKNRFVAQLLKSIRKLG